MKKKILAIILSATLSLSIAGCSGNGNDKGKEDNSGVGDTSGNDVQNTQQSTEVSAVDITSNDESVSETQTSDTQETVNLSDDSRIDNSEIIHDKLQGVWCDKTEDLFSLLAFEDYKIEFSVLNPGKGAASVFSGTYTIDDNELKYHFEADPESNVLEYSGFSNYAYEDDILTLSNAFGNEIKKMSSADILEYLNQEEDSSNNRGVICLADLIINYYPDSNENSIASEKKNEAKNRLESIGKEALQNMNTTYDKVKKITWYEHKNMPKYVDICCYIYPYIGRADDGKTWVIVRLNYTDAQTDTGWLFFDHVIFSVDGENTTKQFRYSDINRDNDTEVWENVDFEAIASDFTLLQNIADSTETIIRFESSKHYVDHIVTDNEKAAITDVLAAYDYLMDN